MYDKDTILSAFDKRGTLVQWLKNLDDTLKNSTLDRIEKVETGDGFAFKFVFANGVELLTPTVEQTASVETVEQTQGSLNNSFKIKLTLSDGNVILSDDFIAPVQISEINVTEITAISQNADGFVVETRMYTDINGRSGINDILVYEVPIVGSDSIIVDVDETNKKIEIHLDADILNDLARMLKTPISAPTSTEIVAVDNTGAQTMLSVGDGLAIEDGMLKSTAGGGLTWKKVTLSELQTYINVENLGRAVKIISKYKNDNTQMYISGVYVISQSNNRDYYINIDACDGGKVSYLFSYFHASISSSGSVRAHYYPFIWNETESKFNKPTAQTFNYFTDSYFDFYIEE